MTCSIASSVATMLLSARWKEQWRRRAGREASGGREGTFELLGAECRSALGGDDVEFTPPLADSTARWRVCLNASATAQRCLVCCGHCRDAEMTN